MAKILPTSQEVFEEFVRPTAPVMGVETDLPYYVKYFDAYKLVLICLEIQKTSNSQSYLEKEEGNWRN